MYSVITKFKAPTNSRGPQIEVKSRDFKTIYWGGEPGDTTKQWHERAIADHIAKRTEWQRVELAKCCSEYTASRFGECKLYYPDVVQTPDESGYIAFFVETWKRD